MTEVLEREIISNELADRYPSTAMVNLWSPKFKIISERRFWLAALKAQHKLGVVGISESAIRDYANMLDKIYPDEIKQFERELRHDVLARIKSFNVLAGHQLIHKAFTSRDVTDCIEQYQIFQSLKLIRLRTVAILIRLGRRAKEYQNLDMAGRSHFVPGQVITAGKRFANWAEELIIALRGLDHILDHYMLRGIKGPMGTQQDIINLFDGDREKAKKFEIMMRRHLEMPDLFESVGQVYPRSIDFEFIARLNQLASPLGNMATTIRDMAGVGLAYEGFSKSQKASSAMPHKMNARTCERINGLIDVLGGFLVMAQSLLGRQRNEGDVSCSVVRRVCLANSFFALDGIYEAAMTVLDEMGLFPLAIENELQRQLPFLSTTNILTALGKKGMGREDAHTLIRNHAIAAVEQAKPETFIPRLLGDPSMPLNEPELIALIDKPDHGVSPQQIEAVCSMITSISENCPGAADINPEPIL